METAPLKAWPFLLDPMDYFVSSPRSTLALAARVWAPSTSPEVSAWRASFRNSVIWSAVFCSWSLSLRPISLRPFSVAAIELQSGCERRRDRRWKAGRWRSLQSPDHCLQSAAEQAGSGQRAWRPEGAQVSCASVWAAAAAAVYSGWWLFEPAQEGLPLAAADRRSAQAWRRPVDCPRWAAQEQAAAPVPGSTCGKSSHSTAMAAVPRRTLPQASFHRFLQAF